ncbi:MAG: alpha-glucan family phosphorylase [Chloroflexi bacterium]|nr:alpha-glucan family phosphorylase [Chloroflexota bacterium]
MLDSRIPARIARLDELANNLWWSWHEQARQVFRTLDYALWRINRHNPVKQLSEVSLETLEAAAADPVFLKLYDAVMDDFDTGMSTPDTWWAQAHPGILNGPVAYFSMEYAIHNSLPIYAGGLGILAGDICKEASDMGIPMVAVGFMYPQGYFHQHIGPDGWQQEIYRQLDFNEAPIKRVYLNGGAAVARVRLGDMMLGLGVWQVQAGRTSIYLLDTRLEENPEEYQYLSARLYVPEPESRIQQEIVLGIGGVRVLDALGIRPAIWHANEGHNAFMMLERIREKAAGGIPFPEAMSQVQAATVFTTHTPVMAGHDVFPAPLMEKYFDKYWDSLGIDRDEFFRLGQYPASGTGFNMTALSMRLSHLRCAVSEVHEKVSRRMWQGIWPDTPEDRVPITHVTNGVHTLTWVAPQIHDLYDEFCGREWVKLIGNEDLIRERLQFVPDEKLWSIHLNLKRKMAGAIRERMRDRWVTDDVPWKQMLAMGALLDPEALTIAFARRVVEYKRPSLILSDPERLKRIVNNRLRPVQIIFAGKAHPADFASKILMQQVYQLATASEFQGRILFVEDYDMHMARYMVAGVDVWLNNPRRLQEASGTSGMKASMNGAPHLSVPDGWWREAYNGVNGWCIGEYNKAPTMEEEDATDAASLYELLEKTIVPLYYKRDRNGIPRGWLMIMKEAMASVTPLFCSKRMIKDYVEKLFIPAAQPSAGRKPG